MVQPLLQGSVSQITGGRLLVPYLGITATGLEGVPSPAPLIPATLMPYGC